MAPLRFAVWGTGFFGRRWIEEIVARPDCELRGVLSRTPERAASLKDELNLAGLEAFSSIEAAKGAGVDAVVVALPPALHREAAETALSAGLDVLLEKPLATNMHEARVLRKAAADHPERTVMVNQNFRLRPHVQTLRRTVRGGQVGTLSHVTLACRQAIRRTTEGGWRERMTHPYLEDFAIHHFDLLRYVTGLDAEEVYAKSFRPPGSWFDGASAVSLVAGMSRGVVLTYHGTMVTAGKPTPPEGLVTIEGDGGTVRLGEGSQVSLTLAGDVVPLTPAPAGAGELAQGLEAFVTAVREQKTPETGVEDNFKSFAFLAAALESARTGRPARVATE